MQSILLRRYYFSPRLMPTPTGHLESGELRFLRGVIDHVLAVNWFIIELICFHICVFAKSTFANLTACVHTKTDPSYYIVSVKRVFIQKQPLMGSSEKHIILTFHLFNSQQNK